MYRYLSRIPDYPDTNRSLRAVHKYVEHKKEFSHVSLPSIWYRVSGSIGKKKCLSGRWTTKQKLGKLTIREG